MINDDDDRPDWGGSGQGQSGDPEVGYGRPPKASQFPPGRSGNPMGRPRGAKTRRFASGGYVLRDALVAEIERMIPVREAGQDITMTQMQAVLRQITIKAMQGNLRAAELLLKHGAQLQRAEQRLNERFLDQILTHKAEAAAEVRRRHASGITDMSDILPHPDHIDVDFATGEVLISGPMSPREQAAIEAGHDHLQMQRQALDALDKVPIANLPPGMGKQVAKARREIEARIKAYSEALGEPYA